MSAQPTKLMNLGFCSERYLSKCLLYKPISLSSLRLKADAEPIKLLPDQRNNSILQNLPLNK